MRQCSDNITDKEEPNQIYQVQKDIYIDTVN